jgi:hypothetical protein
MESDPNGCPPGLDILDNINFRMFGGKVAQETVGRIQKIEVYGPPVMDLGGTPTRYGIATVKVTAAKFRNMLDGGACGNIPVLTPNSVEVGRQVVKMVLNEVPYPGPGGPFTSCTGVEWQASDWGIHWGEVFAVTVAEVDPQNQFHAGTWRSVPWSTVSRILGPADLATWIAKPGVTGVADVNFDPWFKLRAGGAIDPNNITAATPAGDPNLVQPWPFNPATTELATDNFSALMQFAPQSCTDFNYQIWKNVALTGGQDVHYMTYSAQDSYKEDGQGTAQSVHAWTDGQEGFWFFDTTDRLPPDPNCGNCGAEISMTGNWASAGFIYLNADWDSGGTGGGATRNIIAPGEPWNDADGDGIADPGEYVNLQYPTCLTGPGCEFVVDPNAASGGPVSGPTIDGYQDTYETTTAWDSRGLPYAATINFQGVIYVEGTVEMTGGMQVYGAMQTKHGTTAGNAGTVDIYFDERLIKGDWPPPELQLPRTTVTFWQTDM